MTAFKYKKRDPKTVEKRASQRGGDFEGFLSDDVTMFQAKKGANAIRILPPTWEDAETWSFDVWVHYSVGPNKASILCNNKMFGKKCRACEERVKLEASGAEEEEIRQLKPSRRCAAWVLNVDDLRAGVQLWAMPWTVERDINKISMDPRTREVFAIDDPDEGYDVYFDREGEGRQTEYTGLALAKKPSAVAKKFLQYVVDNPIPGILRQRSYEEVVALLNGGADSDEEDESPKKSKRKESAPWDEDEKPAKRRRPADDDEDEEDEKPAKRKRPADDDDEDEKPAKRRRPADDDEDEAPPPRRRRPADDDDDDEDEDEKPTKRKRPADDEDEDEEDAKPAKRKRPADDDDDEDEEDAKPVKRKRPADDDDDEDEEDEKPAPKKLDKRGIPNLDPDDEEPPPARKKLVKPGTGARESFKGRK